MAQVEQWLENDTSTLLCKYVGALVLITYYYKTGLKIAMTTITYLDHSWPYTVQNKKVGIRQATILFVYLKSIDHF